MTKLVKEGDSMAIVHKVEIRPYKHMVHAQPLIRPIK